MESRDGHLLTIRPLLKSAKINAATRPEERFQNNTLRPILKLQNDLIISIFRHYINTHKNVFYELPLSQRLAYIDQAVHKDSKFRNLLKGVVIGQFTTLEYAEYINNATALNKRIINLIVQRLQSNIQLFDITTEPTHL